MNKWETYDAARDFYRDADASGLESTRPSYGLPPQTYLILFMLLPLKSVPVSINKIKAHSPARPSWRMSCRPAVISGGSPHPRKDCHDLGFPSGIIQQGSNWQLIIEPLYRGYLGGTRFCKLRLVEHMPGCTCSRLMSTRRQQA